MNWASVVLQTIWSLFVDDGAFALSAAAWLAFMWLLPAVGLNPIWNCGLLFFGLGLILVHGVLRRTKDHHH